MKEKKKHSKAYLDHFTLFNSYADFIEELMLHGKIRLSDVPFSIRTNLSTLYILATRVSRHYTMDRYKEDMDILKADIEELKRTSEKDVRHLEDIYEERMIYARYNMWPELCEKEWL